MTDLHVYIVVRAVSNDSIMGQRTAVSELSKRAGWPSLSYEIKIWARKAWVQA